MRRIIFDPNIAVKGDAILDVSINHASQTLKQKPFSAKELMKNYFKFSIDFILKDDAQGVEIRLFCKSGFKGAFSSLYLGEISKE